MNNNDSKKLKQTGGDGDEVSKTVVKNSPFVPNQKKEIDRVRAAYPKPAVQASNPLVDLKLYSPNPPRPSKPQVGPVSGPSPYPYHFPIGSPYMPMSQLLQPLIYPIINQYTVSTADPNMDYTKVNMIFEDILPLKELSDSSSTIGERKNLVRFVRAILIKQRDGETISIDGSKKGSLLSYLKFMELNPYHKDPHYNNPLKTLPTNMMLYRTAYPMRYSPDSGSVICADPCIGINVRIYRLNMPEANVKVLGQDDFHKYDSWREMYYYEYIREKVFKARKCPNFVIMFSYYMSENNTINFDKINMLKDNITKTTDAEYIQSITQPMYITPLPNIQPITGINELKTLPMTDQDKVKLGLIMNPKADSRKILIALTEAPTHSLYGWASIVRQRDVNIRRMINTGFHRSKIWFSVIFQLLVALRTLQKERIVIRDFTIKDNVFIKDLKIETGSSGWWKYIVDGIDFYIPNYGYIVQIDSTFKDIPPRTSVDTEKERYKIYSSIFTNETDPLVLEDLDKKSYTQFCDVIRPDAFGPDFVHMGGVSPDSDVKQVLERINKQAITTDHKTSFSEYIVKHMTMFLHNRIGTYLTKKEIDNINVLLPKDFNKGDMLVYTPQIGRYTWVMYMGEHKETNPDPDIGDVVLMIVLTKTDNDSTEIIEQHVQKNALRHYNKSEKIEFITKPNEPKFTEEELLEIYNTD